MAELKPAIQEPPDCSATVSSADGTTTLFDLELAEYYVDNPIERKGGSTAKQVISCWDKVCATLYLRPEKLNLPVDVGVRFKEPVSLKLGEVSSFADQLILFSRAHCPTRHLERITFEVFAPRVILAAQRARRENCPDVSRRRSGNRLALLEHRGAHRCTPATPRQPRSSQECKEIRLDARGREMAARLCLWRNGHEPSGPASAGAVHLA